VGETLEPSDLPREVVEGERRPPTGPAAGAEVLSLRQAEERAVRAALAATGGKKGAAAALLGISWPTLNRKIATFQIDGEDIDPMDRSPGH